MKIIITENQYGRLLEQDDQKIQTISNALNKIVHDGSVLRVSYSMPFDDDEIEVMIEYSLDPSTEIKHEGGYIANIALKIDKAMWKGPYDEDFEDKGILTKLPNFIVRDIHNNIGEKIKKYIPGVSFRFLSPIYNTIL